MFCPNCGNNIHDGNAFCTSCGFNLSSNPKPHPSSLVPSNTKKRSKPINKKAIISVILLIAIAAMAVFSYISLFTISGIEGKWKCTGNDYDTGASWMADGTEFLFNSDKLIITYNSGKQETMSYKIKDGKLFAESDEHYINYKIEYGYFKMNLTTFEDGPISKIYYERINTSGIWIYGGIIILLLIALIITLLVKKKSPVNPGGTIGATYDLSVNPTATVPDTSYLPIETNRDVTSYVNADETFPEVNQEFVDNIPAMVSETDKNSSELADVYTTRCADLAPGTNEFTNKTYDKPEEFETKYTSDSAMLQKSVEIVFTLEESIPSVTSEDYTFTPGTAKVDIAQSEDADAKASETPVVSVIAEEAAVSEVPADHELTVSSENKEKKTSPSTFFKSAGDL